MAPVEGLNRPLERVDVGAIGGENVREGGLCKMLRFGS